MAEYIEREPLLESLRESYETLKLIRNELKYEKAIALEDAQLITFMECILRVKEQPTADVVEVVRCKDCKFYEPYKKPVEDFDGECIARDCETDETDFCNYGERRCEE
jgi:hypothetical protein